MACLWLSETIWYMVFVGVYIAAAFIARTDQIDLWMKQSLENVVLHGELPQASNPGPDTFHDISTVEEAYTWLGDSLPHVLFESPYFDPPAVGTAYSGFPASPYAIDGHNHLVGPLRLKQVRVRAMDGCSLLPKFRDAPYLISSCYAAHPRAENIDTASFGNASAITSEVQPAFTYTSDTKDGGRYGKLEYYPNGGFVTFLQTYGDTEGGPNRSAVELRATVEELRRNGWVDEQTRAVMLDVVVYNPSIGTLGLLSVYFEVLASGGIVPSSRFSSLRPIYSELDQLGGAWVIFLQICVLLFVLWYSFDEARVFRGTRRKIEHRRHELLKLLEAAKLPAELVEAHADEIIAAANMIVTRLGPRLLARGRDDFRAALSLLREELTVRKLKRRCMMHVYLEDVWNAVDLFNLLCLWTALALHLALYLEFASVVRSEVRLGADASFVYLFAADRLVTWLDFVTSINCFFILFKVFKYLREANPSMAQLIDTIELAAHEITYFLAIVVILLLGFALAFSISFGRQVQEFSTVGSSLIALVRAIPEGTLFLDELTDANRFTGIIFYLAYVVLVILVLLNMFLAIIANAYDEVRQKNLLALKQRRQGPSVYTLLRGFLRSTMCCFCVDRLYDRSHNQPSRSKTAPRATPQARVKDNLVERIKCRLGPNPVRTSAACKRRTVLGDIVTEIGAELTNLPTARGSAVADTCEPQAGMGVGVSCGAGAGGGSVLVDTETIKLLQHALSQLLQSSEEAAASARHRSRCSELGATDGIVQTAVGRVQPVPSERDYQGDSIWQGGPPAARPEPPVLSDRLTHVGQVRASMSVGAQRV